MSLVHVAGHPALDFVGTLSERTTTAVEELTRPDLLSQWCVRAGLVDGAPDVDAASLERARGLREDLFAVIGAWMASRTLPHEARMRVNASAAGTPPIPRLRRDGTVEVVGDLDSCLSALSRSALELMTRHSPEQVRWCADRTCTHPYLDTSRAQRRRWCDMATCGTRNKQRDLRRRRSDGA